MNTLRDMGRFPAPVNAGATANVLLTLCATWWVRLHFASHPLALPAWIAFVLLINLMPVVVLRAVGWRSAAPMPTVEQMDFAGDQHRFADWVYLAALRQHGLLDHAWLGCVYVGTVHLGADHDVVTGVRLHLCAGLAAAV